MATIISLSEKTKRVSRHQTLVEEGSVCSDMFYVMSGAFKVSIFLEEEQILRFGYSGDLIGSLTTLFFDTPSIYSISAIKKSEVAIISKSRFEAFLKENPENLLAYNILLQQLVMLQTEREIDLLTNSPKERYRRIMERSPKLFQHVPHKYIANYLRMTPETLSRLQKS